MKVFLLEWRGRIWFMLNMICSVMYLVWRIFFTIPFEYGTVSIVAGISLLIVEALGMVEAFVHYANMSYVRDYPLPKVPEELFPDVDIFISTYSEEPKLLYKTINGCKHMHYPDLNKVHIYLCDDNHRPEMRALAEQMGVNYFDRPDHEGAKAGNLNHAMENTTSPYIVTFDADMIPKSDFLMKTIPYFVDAELKNTGRSEEDQIKLGFVQSPQSFYNPDLFQFNLFSEDRIPNEQDYFYRDIQVARTKTNSVIYGGSNTVISREALNAVGGFYTKAITEDFATGILIQKKGYVCLGTGEPLASGMSPTELKSLVQQRTRWARGVIATGRKMHIFTSKDLSFAQKLNYWASIWYWYAPIKRLIYILSPILYATFGYMVFKCTLPQVLLFWLPMYITSNVSLKMLSNNIRTTKWTSIYETVLFPYMLVPVILESFGITLRQFKVTSKEETQNQKGKNMVYTIPFLILIVLSVIGIINCVFIMFDSGSFGPIVVLFWLVYNLFLLVMSLFFVDGRVPYRKSERVSVQIPCVLDDDIRQMEGVTRDISETGISILLKKPVYIPDELPVEISLDSGMYRADLKAHIVFVNQRDDNWNYSMSIVDYQDTYDPYLQMLYDRIPVLPQEIKRDSGSFEDLKRNTRKHIEAPFFQKRQYPRILLNEMVFCETTTAGGRKMQSVHLWDFNYCYVTLREWMLPEEITLHFTENVLVHCVFESKMHDGSLLYAATNGPDLARDPKTADELLEWLTETTRDAKQRPIPEIVRPEPEITEPEWSLEFFDEKDLVR